MLNLSTNFACTTCTIEYVLDHTQASVITLQGSVTHGVKSQRVLMPVSFYCQPTRVLASVAIQCSLLALLDTGSLGRKFSL